MAGDEECQRVVLTKPGSLTGETLYLTEDGRWWTNETRPTPSGGTATCSPERRYLRGDRLCPHR